MSATSSGPMSSCGAPAFSAAVRMSLRSSSASLGCVFSHSMYSSQLLSSRASTALPSTVSRSEQDAGHELELRAILGEDAECRVMRRRHETRDFLVDGVGGLLAVIRRRAKVTAEEDLLVGFAVNLVTQNIAHAIARDHGFAIFVARSRSLEAPVVTSPSFMISSATRPPRNMARLSIISLLDCRNRSSLGMESV